MRARELSAEDRARALTYLVYKTLLMDPTLLTQLAVQILGTGDSNCLRVFERVIRDVAERVSELEAELDRKGGHQA